MAPPLEEQIKLAFEQGLRGDALNAVSDELIPDLTDPIIEAYERGVELYKAEHTARVKARFGHVE